MEELESKKSKIRRYSIWAGVIFPIVIFSAFKAPEHSLDFIKEMIKDIIQYLILGA